ncbi:hypothetical protein KSS94_02870 [Pseudomonas fakonensis]|uniref:DUF2169 domain-containing protein n=1 Tax=Pseudomonas fakonensis TaxID=2842355 RepID=A0ABX8N6V6_9PSED|nr:hypothetical protein [Pseudomonas fakonensis]QXH52096.1 hypothetical protein KSS94_02870 [Pseudomonas fakonensis]
MAASKDQSDNAGVTAGVLAGWPFLIEFDCARLDQLWARHGLTPGGTGFASSHLQFEVATSSQHACFTNCTLGPLHLQALVNPAGDQRLRIKRPLLNGVQLSLQQAFGRPLRSIAEVRRIVPGQQAELYLDIDLAANYGHYDSQGRVSLGWGNSPQFGLSGEGNGLDVVPYQVYFAGLPAADKFIDLGGLRSESDVVLKPMEFVLRYVGEQAQSLMLHPLIHGKNVGVFPPSYSKWSSPDSGVGMALDPMHYTDLVPGDVAASPSLLFPQKVAYHPSIRNVAGEIRVEFAQQPSRPQAPVTAVPGLSLEPMVKVVSAGQVAEFELLPAQAGDQPPQWSVNGTRNHFTPDGWRCRVTPKAMRAAASQGEGTEPINLEARCEFVTVSALLAGATFTASIVALGGAPTGYLRADLISGGQWKIRLCYLDKEGNEAVISLDDMYADGVNCFVARNGLIEPHGDEPYCIVRAYDYHGDTGVWAFMVLPVPLLDTQTVLGLGIT